MFFSIIIPTYNPKKYLPTLLTSISHNKCIDDIEIIISDDCSFEPFEDILEQFSQLNIRTITNPKHYGFPRNGRQNGADESKGEWICFSDQDDYFVDNAFDDIKQYITDNDIHNCLFCNFIEESVESGKQTPREAKKGWTHGKFYEKTFWNKYNIRYQNVEYCEDISLSTKIECIMTCEHLTMNTYDKPIYIWRRRCDSLADMEYFKKSMPDYIQVTCGTVIDYVEKYKDDEELFLIFNVKFLNTLLNVFFCFQTNILNCEKEIMLKSIVYLQPIFTRFKEITHFTNTDIIYYINTELTELYNQVRRDNYSQIPFVEQISFQNWLLLYFD